MIRTRCFFDMFDNCVSVDMGDVWVTEGSQHQLVDSGLYDFPFGYNALGKSAIDLFKWSATM